ncbi:MAG: hypothetical protein ACOZBH_03725 [Patescibacteria group bacterium]
MKIKIKILSGLLIVAVFAPALIYAGQIKLATNGNVYLRAKQLDWNTYYFEPRTSGQSLDQLMFTWQFDDGFVYHGADFMRSFEPGRYQLTMTATDLAGHYFNQRAVVEVTFWSLSNKWFWGIFFLIIMIFIVYYWLIKLIYLANKKNIERQVEIFLSELDRVHFWKNLSLAMKKKNN